MTAEPSVRDRAAEVIFAARLADGDYPEGTGAWGEIPGDWQDGCRVLADALAAAGLLRTGTLINNLPKEGTP